MEYNEDFKDFRNQQVLKFRIDEIDSFKENENLQIKSEIVDCNFKSNIVDEGHLLAESSSQYIKLETPIVKEETRKASCIINIQDVKLKIKKKLGEFTSTGDPHHVLKDRLKVYTCAQPFECELCIRQFYLSNKLHIIYECEICSRQFRHAENLKAHFRTHTGGKPYKCETCQKNFSNEFNLKKHLNAHIEENAFECEICSKQFSRSSNFYRHMLLHTGGKG
ncbi:uncharacterized protein [Diabrotica undecimpunctata]|uniref:uncharacterized protein isoform X1 n=1 Tax=Diabrotica undecimpunctata TaxID=50387 RepID=UPI003B641637